MFQLLIFFMLSSSLTPYSLITLKSSAEPLTENDSNQSEGEGNDPERPAQASNKEMMFWFIGNRIVRVAGQEYTPDQLDDLAEAIGSQDNAGDVVIIVGSSALVQDVALALEALEGANVGSVQITREGI
tara:strand:+ start:1546 stop:1932 length:387 start_codon:yes stop_codon:yes gene_type:complete